MDRQTLERHLVEADEHILVGQRNIDRQRTIIANLERDGHDSVGARTILQTFEALQSLQLQERDALARHLLDLARPKSV